MSGGIRDISFDGQYSDSGYRPGKSEEFFQPVSNVPAVRGVYGRIDGSAFMVMLGLGPYITAIIILQLVDDDFSDSGKNV